MFEFSFTKGQADAVITATSKDETRYNLNCVRLEAGAIVAVDGQRLHRVVFDAALNQSTEHRDHSSETPDGWKPRNTFHLERADFDRIRKTMKRGDRCTIAYDDAGDAPGVWRASVFNETTLAVGATFEVKPAEIGDFPDYRRVIPSDREHSFALNLDAYKLRELCDAVIKASERKRGECAPVRLYFGDALEAVYFRNHSSGFDGVIMPMRGNPDGE